MRDDVRQQFQASKAANAGKEPRDMSDQEHQPTHGLLDAETATDHENEQEEVATSLTRYSSRGPIPPPLGDFESPKPTASERAYRHGEAYLRQPGITVGKKGLGCKGAPIGREGCLFLPEERATYLAWYVGRVAAAQTHFLAALTELKVEELLKKDPEKSEWILELFFDVIGHLTGSTVLKMFKLLRAGKSSVVEDAAKLAAAMSNESESHLTGLLGVALGAGKKAATAKEESKPDASKPDENPQRTANVAFLTYLQNRAGAVYQHMREAMIEGISDSLFLVLYEAFDERNHSIEVYKGELGGKLKRFEKSGVGKLGITNNESFDPMRDGVSRHDTRAFWVKTPSGRRLGLYRRAYLPIPDTVATVPLHRTATPFDKVAMEMADFAARPYDFIRFVPVEFEAAAVAMHTAKWRTEPVERVPSTPEEISFAGVTI